MIARARTVAKARAVAAPTKARTVVPEKAAAIPRAVANPLEPQTNYLFNKIHFRG
jgi:hypothetical protein